MIKNYIISKFLKSLENIKYGTLHLIAPNSKNYTFSGSDELSATIHIKKWNVITNFIAKGDVGFTEIYRDRLFETDNLVNLFSIALKNSSLFDSYIYSNPLSNLIAQIIYYLQSNTIKGSKRNIHAHYDLGNEFYSLWLDETMTYSSAIFSNNNNDSLSQAQNNKYDRIIEKLNNHSGQLLEIGCGWGGFINRLTSKKDLSIKGITISNEQYKFAQKKVGNKAKISLEDYRSQTGKYENIVSIEMFEAVGEKFWSTYFNKIKSLLKEKGKAVIQTIVIDEKHFDKYRKTSDMIRTFIFPGGMLPSVSKFTEIVNKADLEIIDSFYFGKDYERTLEHWLNNFDNNLSKVKAMNFDDKFIRIWRFYLASCIASFKVGRINVMQSEIVHS